MPKVLTKEEFNDLLDDAIELWGFQYVWDTIKTYSKELDFDEDDHYSYASDFDDVYDEDERESYD